MSRMRGYRPTIRWELKRDQLVYHNDLMMETIEVSLRNMNRFPDAEKIIAKIKDGTR